MDLAAALTYYAVLSLFPALVVVISLLGVVGQGERTSQTLLDIVADISPPELPPTPCASRSNSWSVPPRRPASRW